MSNELEKFNAGIVLRGEVVELHSDVGQKFLTALCRESEGILTSEDLRLDWGISEEDVDNLGSNQALMTALRAELSLAPGRSPQSTCPMRSAPWCTWPKIVSKRAHAASMQRRKFAPSQVVGVTGPSPGTGEHGGGS